MSDFGIYLLKSGICISTFYLLFKIFLNRDTFVARNRFFLLFSILFSLIVPSLTLSVSDTVMPTVNQFKWDALTDFEGAVQNDLNALESVNSSFPFSFIELIYLLGVILSSLRVFKHAIRLIKQISANEIIEIDNLKIISVRENSSPFSFFRYVFLNLENTSKSEQKHILLHESIHAKQYHSVDLILTELLKVIMWFNPFIYLIQKSLIEMHEYLADRECINSGTDKIDYQNALVNNVESRMMLAFTSAFNSSLTLKRIKMIKKINTSGYAHLKMLLVIPVLIFAFVSFGFIESKTQILEGNLDGYYPSVKSYNPVAIGPKVYISSDYGKRIDPLTKKKKFHKGIDIAAPLGTEIYSIATGTVRKVNNNFKIGKGYGRFVIVDFNNGTSGLYSQMDSYNVKEGQKVKAGDVIGKVGSSGRSTGPHLHFEIKKDGENVDPADYFDTDIYKKK